MSYQIIDRWTRGTPVLATAPDAECARALLEEYMAPSDYVQVDPLTGDILVFDSFDHLPVDVMARRIEA